MPSNKRGTQSIGARKAAKESMKRGEGAPTTTKEKNTEKDDNTKRNTKEKPKAKKQLKEKEKEERTTSEYRPYLVCHSSY